MTAEIAIFGAGGYAFSVAEAAQAAGDWRVACFICDDGEPARGQAGIPVLRESEWLADGGGPSTGVVAIGDNWTRQEVVKRILRARPGFAFCSIVHPAAVVAPSARLGTGTVVLAGSVVGSRTQIGQHFSIFSNAVAEHDSALGDFGSLAPGAILGGAVRLGARSFVGLGASVLHSVTIGADAVIGAGSVVVADCPGLVVLAGAPARITRQRRADEPYL